MSLEVLETLVLTLIIFFVIQTFIAQPYQVQQQSMEQTLEPGQYVLVDKLTPRWDDYGRGDIVVFNPPKTLDPTKNTPFIKRVIGLPGRHRRGQGRRPRVRERRRDRGAVHLQERRGRRRSRPRYTATSAPGSSPRASCSSWATTASVSADSRVFGTIPIGNVIGRAFLRYWPISTFGIIQTPTYPDLQPTRPPDAGARSSHVTPAPRHPRGRS